MKPTRDSLDEWKAYAGEMERKARKYETRYRNASDGLITVESLLIDAHAVLTLAMATPRTVRELGSTLRGRCAAEAAVGIAEDLLNKARFCLSGIRIATYGGER